MDQVLEESMLASSLAQRHYGTTWQEILLTLRPQVHITY